MLATICLIKYRNKPVSWYYFNNLSLLQWNQIVKKFEETGVLIEKPVYHRFALFAENIAIVSDIVAEDTNVSIPRSSQALRLSYGILWRILHLDLQLHLY